MVSLHFKYKMVTVYILIKSSQADFLMNQDYFINIYENKTKMKPVQGDQKINNVRDCGNVLAAQTRVK